MNTKRPTNSELRLGRLDEDDARRAPEPGILEVFLRAPEPDEDAPLARDEDAAPSKNDARPERLQPGS